GLGIDHAKAQARTRQQVGHRSLERVVAGEAWRMQPCGNLRKEQDLNTALPCELLQRRIKRQTGDIQHVARRFGARRRSAKCQRTPESPNEGEEKCSESAGAEGRRVARHRGSVHWDLRWVHAAPTCWR